MVTKQERLNQVLALTGTIKVDEIRNDASTGIITYDWFAETSNGIKRTPIQLLVWTDGTGTEQADWLRPRPTEEPLFETPRVTVADVLATIPNSVESSIRIRRRDNVEFVEVDVNTGAAVDGIIPTETRQYKVIFDGEGSPIVHRMVN